MAPVPVKTAFLEQGPELLLYSGLASYGILNPIATAYVLTYADGQKLLFLTPNRSYRPYF